MNAERTSRGKRTVNRGGLPPDDDLSVFAAAVESASDGPTARPLAAVPDAKAPPAAAPPAETAAFPPPAPAAPVSATAAAAAQPESHPASSPPSDELDDDEIPAIAHADLIRQATINVDANVAERFRLYQRREARNGPAPSNAEVVFRALDACEGRYGEIVASRQPQPVPGRRFGSAPVPGRRITTEARLPSQINYRPTYGEVAEIKRLQKQAGARSVSALLDAILDAFLPSLRGGGPPRKQQQKQQDPRTP